MNPLLLTLSMCTGLLPFNRTTARSNVVVDYVMMFVIPVFYLSCYCLVNFGKFGVFRLANCDSICRLGNTLFIHLGCFLYLSIFFLCVLRRKIFFLKFQKSLNEIDEIIQKCAVIADDKMKPPPGKRMYYFTWLIVVGMFGYALYYDGRVMVNSYDEYFFITFMVNSFPYVAGSIVQGQFIYYVSVISDRFSDINSLFEKINSECDKKNAPLGVFDIESEGKKNPKSKGPIVISDMTKEKETLESESDEDDDDEVASKNADFRANDGTTSEVNLPDLFKLHDKILTLSVLTNAEFGPQCVPYMSACFVISIFGIFLETKVLFIVGGKSALLDYVTLLYVIWSLTTIFVAYLVLRLCCNANAHSKQSAMIVHEIMQKKPAFMLGNDLFYNKMKSFTLQFLHWEGYFQFNGIGLFALDYTFIFSTVSAATSYLIVLLQFDMSSILRTEGLT